MKEKIKEILSENGLICLVQDKTADQIIAPFKQELLKCLPEEGIKWMQEGSNKDRKGFTDGYNSYRETLIKSLKEKGLI